MQGTFDAEMFLRGIKYAQVSRRESTCDLSCDGVLAACLNRVIV